MSFLSKLFGGGKSAAPAKPAHEAVEYKGCLIRPEPFPADGQFQTAGVITKEVDGVVREHRFIRADKHASLEGAVEFSLAKGRLIVDQEGDRLWR